MYKSDGSRDAGSLAPSAPVRGTGATGPKRDLGRLLPLLLRCQVRQYRRWFEAFERDGLLPIVLGEIALHNIGATQNGTPNEFHCLPEEGTVGLRPCNAYSIASAINLPRETVRRKVARLIELGWVRKNRNGHLYITAAAHQQFVPLLLEHSLPEVLELAAASADSDRTSR